MFRLNNVKRWARSLKRDVLALWLAARDPRTPFIAKLVGGLVAAYALSPIDLIPDFIPVFGYLDDLLIVPLGAMLAIRLIPFELMNELRKKAAEIADAPRSHWTAIFIIGIWILLALVLVSMIFENFFTLDPFNCCPPGY